MSKTTMVRAKSYFALISILALGSILFLGFLHIRKHLGIINLSIAPGVIVMGTLLCCKEIVEHYDNALLNIEKE